MSEEKKAQIEDNSVHQDYEVITEQTDSYPGSIDSNESKDEQVKEETKKDEQESSPDVQVKEDKQKIQDSDMEQIKMFGNVVKGIVGGFMKEFIPKINEAKTNIKDILSTVLDQVEKENSKKDSDEQSNASDDLEQLVKEIEEEFRSIKDRATMNIIIPSSEASEDEETKDDENEEVQEEDDDQEDEDYEDNQEEDFDNQEEDYEDDDQEEDYDDTFWETYDDRCKFVVLVDDKPNGYFDEFRKAQKYIHKLYNQFISSNIGSFMRTEREIDSIKVYTKTPYLWFIHSEQLRFNVAIDTVYRFKA